MTITLSMTRPAGIPGSFVGSDSKRHAIRDVAPSGTYITGGNAVLPADVGLGYIENVRFGTQVMTGGTAGATANWIGVRYNADGSVIFQQYESAATGLPGLEKTSGEATVANATFRCEFVGGR